MTDRLQHPKYHGWDLVVRGLLAWGLDAEPRLRLKEMQRDGYGLSDSAGILAATSHMGTHEGPPLGAHLPLAGKPDRGVLLVAKSPTT